MGLVYKLYKILRPYWPMILGLCLGFGSSLIFSEILDENCSRAGLGDGRGDAGDPSSLSGGMKLLDPNDDYEPRINLKGKPKKRLKEPQKLVRPRYASTELGIREKLFVAVLSSRDTISTLGVAVNKTLSPYVSKLVFFMNSRGSPLPSGLSIVSFTDDRTILKPFHMFKYLAEHYLDNYDWFFVVPDNTFVRGEKLFDLVSHISISRDIYLGHPEEDEHSAYCGLSAGIVLSQSVLSKIFAQLDWCTKNAFSADHGDNIGRCILHSTSLPCRDSVDGFNFTHYYSPDMDFEQEMKILKNLHKERLMNDAISVHEIKDDQSMYKIYKHMMEVELAETYASISKLEAQIAENAVKVPEDVAAGAWPTGVQAPVKPKSRFDVMRWDYFTEEHIYLSDDFTNVSPLAGADKEDVTQVVAFAVKKLNEKHGGRFVKMRFLNGYRRFDHSRGMEYILDLALTDSMSGNLEVHKRVNLMRPLSRVEIVPMPYVTENTRVTIVLPVAMGERDTVVSFFDSYARNCLDTGDNTYLYIVFIYDATEETENAETDAFGVLKSMVNYYENKYSNGAKLSYVSLHPNFASQFTILDKVAAKMQANTLTLLGSVDMELNAEFLNRVRMNTIQGWQVFFPIGFMEYKPNLVYREKPYPKTVEVKKDLGHFDKRSFDHASFYLSDYVAARVKIQDEVPVSLTGNSKVIPKYDIYDMFLKTELHIFRAIEPSLKFHYKFKDCNPLMAENLYQECIARQTEGLASRRQLAQALFEYNQQKKDAGNGAPSDLDPVPPAPVNGKMNVQLHAQVNSDHHPP